MGATQRGVLRARGRLVAGASNSCQVVIFRPQGSGQSTWGLGVLGRHRNPQQILICGRLEYLCLDMPFSVAPISSSPPVAKAGASGPRGEVGKLVKERAAKAPSTFWVQVLKSAQKALSPPPNPPLLPHSHLAWRKLRWLLGTVGSQSRQPHDESQITLLGN